MNKTKCHLRIATSEGTKCDMLRSSALFVSAAMLLTACSPVHPRAVPAKIKPSTPDVGPQQNCDDVLTGDPESCVAWTPPEPYAFSLVLPINAEEAGTGKGAQWGPYYWCAVITDDVAEKVLGTEDVIRVISSKFYCQIAPRDQKQSGFDNTLSIYLSPYEPGNASFDWFAEPNQLGRVTQVKGRKAVRTETVRVSTSDRAAYTIEIPGHGSVWNVDLRRSGTSSTADNEEADRRVLLAVDALMAYDQA
ncbi:hypothetical protein [Lentzea sp.]|uniref:hypothetical protein n=1 Tax=Lentzea sp. TaxID=56099 RepID=UPI002B9D3647|nr:hypothetical protein [Lentzea sp.]HUQ59271.1 hypothetical protein [Lentzea sp.]